MAEKQLTGAMSLINCGRLSDTWEIKLNLTKELRAAYEKDPERTLTQFLKRRGFIVNSMRFIKKPPSKATRMRDIDILGAKHVHSGPSKSGWV